MDKDLFSLQYLTKNIPKEILSKINEIGENIDPKIFECIADTASSTDIPLKISVPDAKNIGEKSALVDALKIKLNLRDPKSKNNKNGSAAK